jgi:hypothetical protein
MRNWIGQWPGGRVAQRRKGPVWVIERMIARERYSKTLHVKDQDAALAELERFERDPVAYTAREPSSRLSPRLQLLFDARHVKRIRLESLQSAVRNRFPAAEDLVFRETVGGLDLAGDVAALANGRGGLIVIGVRTDQQDRAEGLMPVPLRDELPRVRGIIANSVSPVPHVEFKALSEKNGTGYIFVKVSESSEAPHAVVIDESLRYPQRDGPRNRYLNGSGVEDAYRARFAEASGK